jgi:GNAT superfamily N-acetyltransferase
MNQLIEKASEDQISELHKRIVSFNASKVPLTQQETIIFQNYVIKENGKVIAGISALIYLWGILYIDVLFVEEEHRKKGLGKILLNKVEQEAVNQGSTLVHLDTFDFQAREFYEKEGYEVFGVLSDCPPGHNRYYLKKILK